MKLRSKRNISNSVSDDEEDVSELIKVVNNNIYFYSPVTKKSVLELNILLEKKSCELLNLSLINNIDPIPILLHINSEGGEVAAALSVVDSIINCKVPIYSIIEGNVASAATLISIVCHKRKITKNAMMLIHQVSGGIWGKMSEFEDEMKNMTLANNTIKKLYKKYTKITDQKLEKILKKDIYWSSKICLKYGLVDEII